ncbi:MAG TPA: tetratricopeptide repeat protein [Gammaproteobacteria bacterium]|nr:tetratricopeptide repeat protein [Gammaproteobacteria bacterium]
MNLREQWQTAHSHYVARRLVEAEQGYRQILQQVPNNAQLLYTLAQVCYELQKSDEAIDFMERACRLDPDNPDLRYSLGALLSEVNQQQVAIDHYQAILGRHPDHIDALLGLGIIYTGQNRFSEAIACYERILQSNSNNLMAHYNLGLSMMNIGQVERASECFNRALAIDPGNLEVQTASLFILHAMPDVSGEQIYERHREWARRQERGYLENHVTAGRAGVDRPLRVGYVSPDFRSHSVAYFIKPILEAHNRERVTCYCYSNTAKPDSVTGLLKELADHWRDIVVLDDEQAAQMIRDDGIDILVDLSGHTMGNRLMIFTRKPAPVQVTWIGYPGTTGLSAMDYRITDSRADPPGQSDTDHVEKLVRMEPCFLCFDPQDEVQVFATAPVRENGYITFGSFNSLAKYSASLIAIWAQVLRAVPGSKLLLKSPLGGLGDAAGQGWIQKSFASAGIGPERIECVGRLNELHDHLALYNRVDVALDTFPYNGTTTTCEALWMGVPVITLAGRRHASRVGASLLHAAGLSEHVAETEDEFVAIAQMLAEDVNGLEESRSGLRERLRRSALLDKSRTTEQVEKEYFRMLADIGR